MGRVFRRASSDGSESEEGEIEERGGRAKAKAKRKTRGGTETIETIETTIETRFGEGNRRRRRVGWWKNRW